MKYSSTPGVALCVINGGKVIYQKSYGKANTSTNAFVTDTTVFEIASVTKMFTALALLEALKKNNISVDAPIGKVVAGLSPQVAAVTFAQLLSHTSGIMDYFPAQNNCRDNMFDYFATAGAKALFAMPGEIFSYSNNGYALAGLALATLAKTSYPNAVEQYVFKPLGLNSTSFNLYKVANKPLSSGHFINSTTKVATPALTDWSSPRLQPSGGMFSNIKDLSIFATTMLNKGRLNGVPIFSDTIVQEMGSQHTVTFSVPASYLSYLAYPNPSYGYGIMRFTYNGLQFIGHAGEANTQNAMLYMCPEKKFAVIMLSNRGFYLFNNSFKKIVEEIIGAREQKQPAPIVGDTNSYGQFTGKYVVPTINNQPQEWSEIITTDGKLFMKTEENKMFALEQIGEASFRFNDPNFLFPIEIAFYKNEAGKVAYLNYYFRSRKKVN